MYCPKPKHDNDEYKAIKYMALQELINDDYYIDYNFQELPQNDLIDIEGMYNTGYYLPRDESPIEGMKPEEITESIKPWTI